MPKNASRNPLSPDPEYAYHRPGAYWSSKKDQIKSEIFRGVHTTGNFEVAAAYAIATAKAADRDKFDKNLIYPVVLTLDVTGLQPLPDYDAIQQLDVAEQEKEYIAKDLEKGISPFEIADRWESFRESEVTFGDDPSGVIFENAVHANIVRAVLDFVKDDEEKALFILERWLETGEFDDEIATYLVDQRRYKAHFDIDRLIQIDAVRPYWPEILESWEAGRKFEKRIEKIEAAGWQAVTIEDYNFSVDSQTVWQNQAIFTYLFNMKREDQFHGTSSKHAEEAFGIQLPPTPYPVHDPWGRDDESEDDE